MELPRIAVNMIQTPDGTILQSKHRHDYVTHVDKTNGLTYMVDGGTEYLRRNSHPDHPYKEMSLTEDADHSILREKVCWGTRGKDGKQPLRYISISSMDTDHIEAVLETQTHMSGVIQDIMKNELAYRNTMETQNAK